VAASLAQGRHALAPFSAFALGVALLIWIAVEIAIIGGAILRRTSAPSVEPGSVSQNRVGFTTMTKMMDTVSPIITVSDAIGLRARTRRSRSAVSEASAARSTRPIQRSARRPLMPQKSHAHQPDRQ
jgi:hypothetical protein